MSSLPTCPSHGVSQLNSLSPKAQIRTSLDCPERIFPGSRGPVGTAESNCEVLEPRMELRGISTFWEGWESERNFLKPYHFFGFDLKPYHFFWTEWSESVWCSADYVTYVRWRTPKVQYFSEFLCTSHSQKHRKSMILEVLLWINTVQNRLKSLILTDFPLYNWLSKHRRFLNFCMIRFKYNWQG